MTFQEAWDKMTNAVELVQVHQEEMLPLWNRILELKRPSIVEVGSAHGASSMILAEAVKQVGGFLYCIDPYPEFYYGQEKFGDYARKQFKKNMADSLAPIGPVIHLDTDSSKARYEMTIPLPGIDLLFVDGDHSYEGVKADCINLLPLVAPGGYVAFHDYNNPAFDGVKRAADEQKNLRIIQSVWDLIIMEKI